MIIPMRWRDVPGGVRVILSSGRVARTLERIAGLPHLVTLRRDAWTRTGTQFVTVDPDATVPVIFAEEEVAVAALKTCFPKIEFLREEGR